MQNKEEKQFLMLLGKRLRKLRKVKNLSQEDLANDADIPINQVGRIERAEIATSITTLYKLAKAMNIEIYLFFMK